MTTKRLIISIFFLCLWLTTIHAADPVYQDRPKDIRVTGTLLAPSAKEQEDIVTINIFLGDAPRLLRVGSVENLSPDEKERAVDADILMRQVRFYGPDDLIHRLEQPDTVGKVLIMEGRLDAKERKFLVKSVTEKPGGKAASPAAK